MSDTELFAVVARVIDDSKLVINKGSKSGVKFGDRFWIYELLEGITDPESGDPLGDLEISRGTGKVIHVQEKMAIIKSDMTKPLPQTVMQMVTITPPTYTTLDFDNPSEGDKAKRID